MGWLVACAVVMGIGAITSVASMGSAMIKDRMNAGVGGFIAGAIMLLIGFFGGVVVILMYAPWEE